MTNANKITDPAEMAVHSQPMAGHPGPFIRDVLIPEYGLNVAKAARLLRVNRANFIDVLNGKYGVSRDLAYKLGALMRDEVCDLLIEWQHRHDLENEASKREAFRQSIARIEVAHVAV